MTPVLKIARSELVTGCLDSIGPWVNSDKLNDAYMGPFLVLKRIGEVNYLIQRYPKFTPLTVHVDDLKQYFGNDKPESWVTDV